MVCKTCIKGGLVREMCQIRNIIWYDKGVYQSPVCRHLLSPRQPLCRCCAPNNHPDINPCNWSTRGDRLEGKWWMKDDQWRKSIEIWLDWLAKTHLEWCLFIQTVDTGRTYQVSMINFFPLLATFFATTVKKSFASVGDRHKVLRSLVLVVINFAMASIDEEVGFSSYVCSLVTGHRVART